MINDTNKQLPADFTNRLKTQFADAKEFIEGILQNPHYSLRINQAKPDYEISGLDKVQWCPNAFYLTERPMYTLDPLFHAGYIYPQEASSMFLWHVLSNIEQFLPENPIVLDLCAAPGGKSTLITSFFDEKGVVVANEVIRSRAWILRENIVKWGYSNNIVTNNDPSAFAQEGATFDLIAVDAPCSGEGMFRKDATAVDEWSAENANLCAQRQKRILMQAYDALVEGGILIYSTCTFNPEENERNMEWLSQQVDIEFKDIPTDNSWNISAMPFNGGTGYAFHPHKARGEGFFICAMQKTGGETRRKRNAKEAKQKAKRIEWPIKAVCNSDQYVLTQDNDDTIIALPIASADVMKQIAQQFTTLHYGIPLGQQTRKEFVPNAALPLSIHFDKQSFPSTQVDKQAALRFLRGEWSAEIPANQGWNTVCYQDATLGFVKTIGNRVNNYYPKEWRIRMQVE